LASVAVKIGILVVASVVFIVVYGWLIDYLQRRGP
jgi:preprotein translocase subunit SecE